VEQRQDDKREKKSLPSTRASPCADAITLDIIIKSIMLNRNEMKTLAFSFFANEIRICARFQEGEQLQTQQNIHAFLSFPGGIHLCRQ
jgi:hypothetical protein